ncbi:MAG TPA: hypothetical protein VGI96_01730, partial [Streptosporangiaceae bacterium]
RPECELAYHNQLMVLLWSSLGTQDARLAATALRRMKPIPPETTWVTYVRGHDDIGWAVSDADAESVGVDGFGHRRFLNDFYSGRFPGSFARGALFQENEATGDARISGSAASLCGIEEALERGDEQALDAGIRRLELLYSVAYAWGGIPLLYMGDELAMRNDRGYLADPARAPDNRWMHRPPMDWDAAARRHQAGSLEGRVFGVISALARARRSLLALRAGGSTKVLPTGNHSVLGYRRAHPRSAPFLSLTNFSDITQSADAGILARAGLYEPAHVHSSAGRLELSDGRIELPPWGFAWIAGT